MLAPMQSHCAPGINHLLPEAPLSTAGPGGYVCDARALSRAAARKVSIDPDRNSIEYCRM